MSSCPAVLFSQYKLDFSISLLEFVRLIKWANILILKNLTIISCGSVMLVYLLASALGSGPSAESKPK